MATKYDDAGDGYVLCETEQDLEQEVIEAGYENLQQFEDETGTNPKKLIGKWWLLIGDKMGGRVFIKD